MKKTEKKSEADGQGRRTLLHGALGTGLFFGAENGLSASAGHGGGATTPPALNPAQKEILTDLLEGNERYVTGRLKDRDLASARKRLTKGQKPKIAVMRCADSRVAPELVFDQSLGELFVCGVAGNIPTPELIASIEYAVLNLGTELILVMGHTSCGAVDAAVKNQDAIDALPGNLPDLLAQILPSVLKVKDAPGDTLAAAIKQNAADAAHRITKMSTVLDDAASRGKLGIASGVYDLETGRFNVTNPD